MNKPLINKPKINAALNSIIKIESASENDFELIKVYINKFELDNRHLELKQFIVAKYETELVGFGRIRKHANCDELCSIGVLEKYRRNGIATKLVLSLLINASEEVYLVCINPDYFKKLNFEITSVYPSEMIDKLNYCTNELVVPEKYVVMHYQKGNK